MSRNAEDCENSGSLPQLESEPEVEQIGEVSEEVPFEIPKKWKWLRLAFLVEKARQKVPDKTFYYVDVSSVSSGKGLIGKMAIIEAKQAPSRARKIVEEGMVLFSTVRPYLKNVCLALKIPKETIASTAFATFSCSAYLNNRFALYVLTSPYFMNYVAQVQKGIAYPAISDKDFYSAYIPVPPLAEQHRIVARLNELLPLVDDFGEAQEAFTIAQTEFPGKLEASLLQAAIEGKLVPQLESEPEVEQIGEAPEEVPFEIPKKWKWFKLDKLVSVISGTSYKPNDISSEGIRIIRGGNIDNFKVSFKPDDVFLPKSFKEEKLIVKSTDIVIVASTGSLEVIGKPGVISEDLSGKCQIGAFLRIIRPKQTEFSQYLKFIFMSDFYRCRIRRLVKGTNIRNIKKEYIADMVIPLPPLAEQRRIVARLNKLLASIDQLGD